MTSHDTISSLRALLAFTGRFRHLWPKGFRAMASGAAASALQLLVPLSSVVIINRALPERDVGLLVLIAGAVGLATLLSMVAAYGEFYYSAVFRERMTLEIQRDLLDHLQRLSMDFFRRHDSGYMMSRVLSDGEQAVDFTAGLTSAGRSLVLLLTATILVPFFHPVIGVVVLSVLPLYGGILVIFNRRVRDRFHVVQEDSARASRELHQALGGILETKAYCAEARRTRRYVVAAARRVRSLVRGRALMALGGHSTKVIILGVSVFILVYGGFEVMQGDLSLGELVALNALTAYLLAPVNEAVSQILRAQKSLAAIERIEEVFDERGENGGARRPASPGRRRPVPPAAGHVRFEGVRFEYLPGQPILRGIDLEILAGETVLILGPSGVGKTTLVSLLPRFCEPTGGFITLDGKPLRELPLRYLRDQIAFVSQDTFLFSESVYENIRLGRPRATREEVLEAARAANVLDFALELPQGLDTEVGERGCRLSGGQRQRIAAARALLKGASVLVLDEATSAVDAENEIALHEAVRRLCRDRTTIVIAHHATNLIDRIDRTLVLEAGKICTLNHPGTDRLVRAACS